MSAIFADTNLSDLMLEQDQATIYAAALQIAQTLGLPTTSWQAGDPTRSLLYIEAALIESLESIVVGFIQSGFLDYAQGEWLSILALEQFNVTVPAATFAETSVTLTNALGNVYILEGGDVQVKNSSTGATYTSTSGGTLTGVGTAGATLSITVVADVAGSGGTSAGGNIDTMVTTFLGVTCTNPVSAVGIDEQAPATTIAQCRAKQAALSPNGPAQAYEFVSLNQTLTGTQNVTRARVYDDSETGDVTVYLAGPGGAVLSADVTAVTNAITLNATPLCITPTVLSSSNVVINVTYQLWVYQSVGQTSTQIQTSVALALANWFLSRPIGGDIIPPATTGAIYQDMMQAIIGAVFPLQTFRVVVSLPSGDTTLTNGQVAVLGTVTATVNIIAGP